MRFPPSLLILKVCLCLGSVEGSSLKTLDVSAKSAILINADTGKVLYEKNAHLPLYPASITKVATALFLLDVKKPDWNQKVEVKRESLKIKPAQNRDAYPAHWGEVDGTRAGLLKGEKISLEALFYGMMLVSGNDAANVFAESLSVSIPHFVQEMNQYLKNLGCHNTRFANPHGLHHRTHYTTAYDMSLIMKKALHFPKFREVTSTPVYRHEGTNKRKPFEMFHTNGFLKKGKDRYPKIISVKSGYHALALQTQIAAAEHEGRTLIAVVMGCPERSDKYTDIRNLFEAAFSEERIERVFGEKGSLWSCTIPGGAALLQATIQKRLCIAFYPSEEPSCKVQVDWSLPPLPISKGAVVGTLRVVDQDGKELAQEDLIASERVEQALLYRLCPKFLRGRIWGDVL